MQPRPVPDPPDRRSVRLLGHDYAESGSYFVTLCAAQRRCIFGTVVEREMFHNALGTLVRDQWHRSVGLFSHLVSDAFVVMPNHVHALLRILPPPTPPMTVLMRVIVPPESRGPRRRSVSSFIGGFKAAVTMRARQSVGVPDVEIWQRGFHEHLIRSEESGERIRLYIEGNPLNWETDRYRPRDG